MSVSNRDLQLQEFTWPFSDHILTPPLAFQTKTGISQELDIGEWAVLNAISKSDSGNHWDA